MTPDDWSAELDRIVADALARPLPWRTRALAWLRRLPGALARAGYWGGVTMWGAIKAAAARVRR